MAKGVAKRIMQFFWRGGNVLESAHLAEPLLKASESIEGLREWDWSGRRPFPLRDMTGCGQTWGGGRFLGEGSFGMFSPPVSDPFPLPLSEKGF